MADELLTPEQREEYLGQLARRVPPNVAAAAVGFTGTQLRGLRSRDPEFNAACAEAIVAGAEFYRDRLMAQAAVRALADSDRMLEVELATHVPGYEHLRRDKVKHEGRIEHAIVLTPEQIEALSDDDLDILDGVLAKVEGDIVVEGRSQRELPPASGNGRAEAA